MDNIVLHCAESIKCLLHDPDIMSSDLVAQGEKRYRGIGVIEAPRGTLFHDYQIDENDIGPGVFSKRLFA
jgi:NAD-reducing hydrogenase large subunit